VTNITLKNDPGQKSPFRVSRDGHIFAKQIPFQETYWKNLINKLATLHLVRPILTPLV
jgi:hypothetical protein